MDVSDAAEQVVREMQPGEHLSKIDFLNRTRDVAGHFVSATGIMYLLGRWQYDTVHPIELDGRWVVKLIHIDLKEIPNA